jgi:hypothetical protein
VKYAKAAARFDRSNVDPITRRKLTLLKLAVTLPAPGRPGRGAGIGGPGPSHDPLLHRYRHH